MIENFQVSRLVRKGPAEAKFIQIKERKTSQRLAKTCNCNFLIGNVKNGETQRQTKKGQAAGIIGLSGIMDREKAFDYVWGGVRGWENLNFERS